MHTHTHTQRQELIFQNEAVNEVIEKFENQISEVFLQAPTGSGKTFIIAKTIENYISNIHLNPYNNTTFLFISPSDGKLDYQSYEKISSYLQKDWVKGFSTKFIGTSDEKKGSKSSKSAIANIKKLEPNTVYFIGWSMLNSSTRLMNRNSEQQDFYGIIDETKREQTNIVLIIDEAHRNKNEKSKSKERVEIINALEVIRTLKVSATLVQNQNINKNQLVLITASQVKEDYAIKNEVHLNYWQKLDDQNWTEDERLIKHALALQERVKKEYHKVKINRQPLILIQLPNDPKDTRKEEIEAILNNEGLKKNLTYTVWLDKEKPKGGKKDLISDSSSFQVLIFKQAIAVGWDIPRANILVRLRDSQEEAFNIQTLGRILRNPNFKYFKNKYIDDAYVFSSDENYQATVLKEYPASLEERKVLVKRSLKAINSNFSIPLIKFEPTSENRLEIVKKIALKLIDYFKTNQNFFNIDPSTEANYFKHQAEDFLEGDKLANRQVNKDLNRNIVETQHEQLSFKDSLRWDNYTLYQIWVRYETVVSKLGLLKEVSEYIVSQNLLKAVNQTIKNFYKAIYFNSKDKMKFKKDLNIIEWIKREYQKECQFTWTEETYYLPKEYEYLSENLESYNKESDYNQIDTYCLNRKAADDSENLNGWDSLPESKLYSDSCLNWEVTKMKAVHIFRNTPTSQGYSLPYFDPVSWTYRRFYPDLFLINDENKTTILIEVKGYEDIDRNTDKKILGFKQTEFFMNQKAKQNDNFLILDLVKVTPKTQSLANTKFNCQFAKNESQNGTTEKLIDLIKESIKK